MLGDGRADGPAPAKGARLARRQRAGAVAAVQHDEFRRGADLRVLRTFVVPGAAARVVEEREQLPRVRVREREREEQKRREWKKRKKE